MAKKPTKQASGRGEGRSEGILERLSGVEAASILNRLLDRHPELRSEAETLAAEALSDISLWAVAEEVEWAVLQFDYDDLNGRAGRHSWGYVEPAEAAWELLEEAVQPFIDDMRRLLELGLEEQARELCQGILLGLYRVRDNSDNDILNWAPDFPPEEAGDALDVWANFGRTGRKAGRRLPPEFVAEHIPEWKWALQSSDQSR